MSHRDKAIEEYKEILDRKRKLPTLLGQLKKRRFMCKQPEHRPQQSRGLDEYELKSPFTLIPHTSVPLCEWAMKTLVPKSWNELRYTQITPNTKARNPIGPWACNPHAKTLLEGASNVLLKNDNAVLAFHGTSTRYIRSIADGLVLSGEGCMDTGLYVTLDPSEAMGYACRVSDQKFNPMILELVINKADDIRLDGVEHPRIHEGDYGNVPFKDAEIERRYGNVCAASRDAYVAADFALHTRGCLRKIELIRAHTFARDAIRTFPTYRNPEYQPDTTCAQYYDQRLHRDAIEYEPREDEEWSQASGVYPEASKD